ncbi:MAG: PAS domain-containing protein [Prosthecobacter sp.]|uniref:PAS domain-containing hybrid sensor histidine kinase/response regulator n=1 Tax=Prosthecobacter sp. TaxID=1965333 RepID=UPI0019DF56AE|nr:PAS domain-containing protein [Prosthecobacter sp.]MBE2285642.1 PAS domain-containing protein [Prosthecobacter sp.]
MRSAASPPSFLPRRLREVLESASSRTRAWWVAAIYAVMATLWILFSDYGLRTLISSPELLLKVGTYKGLFYVVVTSVLLLLLMRKTFGVIDDNYLALKLEQEQKQRAEVELRRSEQRFRSTLDSMREGCQIIAHDWTYLYLNDAAVVQARCPREQLLGRRMTDVWPGFEQTLVHDHMNRCLRNRIPFHGETKFTFHDGTTGCFDVRIQPVPEGAFVVSMDITEKKQTAMALQHTHDLLKAVADGLPDAVFVKDQTGHYLLFNEGAARLVGKPVEEILGRDDTVLFDPEDARMVMAYDQAVMASGESQTSEEDLTVAGFQRTLLTTKAPFRDANGKVIGVLGISRDITERKQSENKIREQAALLDRAQDAIILRDLDDRVLYWNRSAERLYGWTTEEVVGRSIKDVIYRDPTAFNAATATVLEKGEWMGELQPCNRSGQPLTIESRWSLVCDEEGRPESILTINTDISQRKQLEEQFLRAQRMESIGTLAGGIAHDLNNVLTPILMSLELLRLGEQNERRLSVINTIESSANRGADMVRQVLSFARGVAGRQVELQVRHLLREMEKIINETFLKTIRVVCDVPSDLWTVTGDPTQLHQVLLNLCVNARDAMPNGGLLTLSAENVKVDEQYTSLNLDARPGPHVLIKVTDTGSGMPPEIVRRIFEPFFTTKDIGQGTGLGLSTSLAIIKSHQGFVQVRSEPGEGTTFSLFLPARTSPSADQETATVDALPHGHGETILLVDDEEAVIAITREMLETFGYRVLTASDGAEAVTTYTARQKEIAVVLTDMMMPVMNGASTIQVLLSINPKARVVAASGLNVEKMVAQAKHAGVRHFIPKPYTAETLLTLLHQVLQEDA